MTAPGVAGCGAHAARMARFAEAGLYLVTSQSLSAGRTTPEVVRSALSAGVRLVQLREKDKSDRDLVALAGEVRRLTAAAGALLLINDRVDVALAVGADGVHLGQDDFPLPAARRLGPDLIIGASTHSVAEALRAQEQGASYINIGPVFATATKSWSEPFLGFEGLRRVAAAARVPFTVMGGIQAGHVPALAACGAGTIAVVTAVTAAPDPGAAARRLLNAIASARRSQRPECP